MQILPRSQQSLICPVMDALVEVSSEDGSHSVLDVSESVPRGL